VSDLTEIGRRVDAAAANVTGVVRLYSAAPALVGVARVVTSIESSLSVVHRGDPLEVTVNIGVGAAEPGAAVAERVAAAVHAELGQDAHVHVRVSRVHQTR
jgi:hypothetical protein